MKRILLPFGFGLLVLVLVSLLVQFPGEASKAAGQEIPAKFNRSANPIPNQYIVVFNDDTPGLSVPSVVTSLTTTHGGSVRQVFRSAIKGFSVELTEAAAIALSKDPRVKFVEENTMMSPGTVQLNPPSWGLDRIDQRDLELNHSYTYNSTGAGVHVYVIDTGIRPTHVEFGGRASADYDTVDDDNNPNTPAASDNNGLDGIDCYVSSHGDHVAGTIGGSTVGVAKSVRIHAVRVFGCSGGSPSDVIIAGVDWVTQNHQSPAVANMSLGGPTDLSIDAAVNGLINSGVTCTVSAGNDNANAGNASPARVPAAITVGATDIIDHRAGFSNFGPILDLFAPGVEIISAAKESDTAMQSLSGTSMAAPHVAGVAALYLQNHPTAAPAEVAATIVANATSGRIIDPGLGSPNLLLNNIYNDNIPFDDAVFLSQSVPATMTAGLAYSASITMKNIGGSTWAVGAYSLGSQNPADNTTWGLNRVALPASVAPGAQVTFSFTVVAPTPGTYDFQWRMVREGIGSFGGYTTNKVVNVLTSPDNSEFVSQSVPANMNPGQAYVVTVSMRNTGSAVWTDAAGYKLGSQSPQDNTTWGLNRVPMPTNVAPGVQANFSFFVTAPSQPGMYNFQWRMVRNPAGWFGQYSTNVVVNVGGVPVAPANLTATIISNSQVNLNWQDLSNNETGFKIERKPLTGSYSQIALTAANATSYPNTGLSPSTSYCYRIRSTNANGDSSYSNEVCVTTPGSPPAAPTNLVAYKGCNGLCLTWSDNSNNEDGFVIERRVGSYGPYSDYYTNAPDFTDFCDEGLSPIYTYFYYRVRAYNGAGSSAPSNAVFILTTCSGDLLEAEAVSAGGDGDERNAFALSSVSLSDDGSRYRISRVEDVEAPDRISSRLMMLLPRTRPLHNLLIRI